MNNEQRKRSDSIVDNFVFALQSLDESLQQMLVLSRELPVEEKKNINKAISLLLEHLQASVNETKILLVPTPDLSKDYTV